MKIVPIELDITEFSLIEIVLSFLMNVTSVNIVVMDIVLCLNINLSSGK